MNDEIKEILRKSDIDALSYGVVVNYITNLQQDYDNEVEENLKLSEWLVEKQQRIQGLEAENKRLKEQSLLLIDYQDMEQRYEDYKFRCEKASRTLETLKGSARWERHLYEVDYLLNILQNGSDSQ